MIEHVFSPEMMHVREKQLILALLDCAGVYYDVNFTQDRILGVPIQIVDGVAYPILEQIGKPANCSYSEIIDYWASVMPPEEVEPFCAFSSIPHIQAQFAAGEEVIAHRFWTFDVLGNRMLAEQKIRLYRDHTNGDLLGLVYVSNGGEFEAMQKKEAELNALYREASHRTEFFQKASVNLPGGYHRCSIEEGYPFLFISRSFEELVGYTKEQLCQELDNKFINLVLPEDIPRLTNLERPLIEHRTADVAFRIRRRDGQIRWVQDSILLIEWDGEKCFQCSLADITDFVHQQEQFARQKAEFDSAAENIPCGYHRCSVDNGFRLEFVSESFMEVVGYSREELIGKSFMELIAPEDRAMFMSHEPELAERGKVNLAYRIRRKDGSYRWIQDSTTKVEFNGRPTYQCTLGDITDFVKEQEVLQRNNLELIRKKTTMEAMEANMPSGYHRCKAEAGCPFIYIGKHFTDIVGFSREEIEQDFGNLYQNLIWPEDAGVMRTFDEMCKMQGKGNAYDTSVYRMKHKDGGYRWVTDSTMFVDMGEESYFQATIADITQYMDSMNEAIERAEASSQAKSVFLFNASHDIRTPMNAIKGFAHMIEQNINNPQMVGETISKIQQAADTLMTLMNDVLDLARIEQGKEEVNAQTVDLHENRRNLYELFAAEMKDAGINFVVGGDALHDYVRCDNLKLTRIVMNMLSNAKKFTPAGGTVTFGGTKVRSDGNTGTYRFFVRDTGIGMSKEFLSRAFEQFERERTSTESGVTGSGLGLAIIKKLVELMGGTVDIQSELGKGTEISATLTFPLVRENELQDRELELVNVDMTGKRVLLVEDNAFNREIARYVLEDMHFAVEEAQDGAVCLQKLLGAQPGHYDLILMDLQMPVMDGYRATIEIRNLENKTLAATPIIAMTANAFDEDKQRCLAVGMDGHIGKPIDLKLLARELYRIM